MTTSDHSDVLIVGGGLAGLSASVALSAAGAGVTLLERKPYEGGRAYSYLHPALDDVIDSQHVMLGCCTNLIDICKLSGADEHIRWYDDITFLEPANSGKLRASVIGPGFLPAPAHSALRFLRAPMLTPKDKSGIALGLLNFLRGYPSTDEEAFSTWLQRTRQTQNSILHFWEPVIVGALNDSFERCSTRYAGQVFYESFLKNSSGGRLGIPTQPMTEFYTALTRLCVQQGTKVHFRCSVDRIEQLPNGDWQAQTSDGQSYTAKQIVLALPFEQTSRLVATFPVDIQSKLALRFEAFTHAPITTLHLWFDRPVTELDHAALLDTRIQWMFNKTRIRRDEFEAQQGNGQYLELVISASFAELKLGREAILNSALEELAAFFPEARSARLVKSGVLKEARATFSVTPGLDAHRPAAQTALSGLVLAGDWTRTGWPSTMESAVRSGRLAAEAITNAAGKPQSFLTADLPASGLMNVLTRCIPARHK